MSVTFTALRLSIVAGALSSSMALAQTSATSPPPGPGQGGPARTVNPAVRAPSAPPRLPPGVSPVLYGLSVPADRVPAPEWVALGDKLFNDKRLSADDSTSCATCHEPSRGFVDHLPTSVGIRHQKGQRNAPTVLNALFGATQFWDGRSATLEDQAKLPILNPIEMGQKSGDAVAAKVAGIPEYAAAFQKLTGRKPTYEDIASALAAFERIQFSGSSAFDRFIGGDRKALDPSARRGWSLFNGKARCSGCHAGNSVNPLFTDHKFHNIGISAHKQDFAQLAREGLATVQTGNQQQIDELAIQTKFSELGRFLVTKRTNDIGAFKTPTLRNVLITAPYFHDGTQDTLWDVVDHYNKGGEPNPFLDGGMQRLGLTEPEIDDLVAFMAALTDTRYAAFAKKELARQRSLKNKRPVRDTAAAMGKKGDFGDVGVTADLKDPADLGFY